MIFKKIIIYIITVIYLFSNRNQNISNRLLARVNKNLLYEGDIKNLVEGNYDSLEKEKILRKSIDDWVEKQLIIAEAQRQKDYDEIDIEQRLLEYKYALIVHNFLEKQISEKINTVISEEEINNYYEENLSDFELKGNIVRGKFAVIPKNTPNRVNFERLFLSDKEESLTKLIDYCKVNAVSCDLDYNEWHKFDDIIDGTPLQGITRDKLITLKRIKRSRLYKITWEKDNYIYYFNIKEFKILNQISPLDFVRKKIIDTILYKRKMDLKRIILKEILEKAKIHKDFEIYDLNIEIN